METIMFILLAIGIVLIIVSLIMTGFEKDMTPGLRDELTEDDKKRLEKMTDHYISHLSKGKISDAVNEEVRNSVEREVEKVGTSITEKISTESSRIADAGDEKISELDSYFDELQQKVERNKKEVDNIYSLISDKEKNIKVSLNLVDEYRSGLEKMKASIDEDQEIPEKKNIECIKPISDAEDIHEMIHEEYLNEQSENKSGELSGRKSKKNKRRRGRNLKNAEECNKITFPASEETVDEVINENSNITASETDEKKSDFQKNPINSELNNENQTADELGQEKFNDAESGILPDSNEEDLNEEDSNEDDLREEDSNEDDSNEDDLNEEDSNEDYLREEDSNEDDLIKENIDKEISESYEVESYSDENQDKSGCVTEEDEEENSEAETQVLTASDNNFADGETDEYQQDEFSEPENLDEILSREGIHTSEGDTIGNIMEMFNAGFSIIEISKVMSLGVDKVKDVIDTHQGE